MVSKMIVEVIIPFTNQWHAFSLRESLLGGLCDLKV